MLDSLVLFARNTSIWVESLTSIVSGRYRGAIHMIYLYCHNSTAIGEANCKSARHRSSKLIRDSPYKTHAIHYFHSARYPFIPRGNCFFFFGNSTRCDLPTRLIIMMWGANTNRRGIVTYTRVFSHSNCTFTAVAQSTEKKHQRNIEWIHVSFT